MSTRQTLKAINQMTTAVLKGMTDAQLEAIATPYDMTGFTDDELQAIITDTADPALLARVDQTKVRK